jgi:purine nucleosidase
MTLPIQIPNVIFSHDGNLDDLISLIVLISAHKKGKINLVGVFITPADSFLEPALFATRKIIDIMKLENVIIGVCDEAGINPFPDEWRKTPYSVCHMPSILRDGEPRYIVSNELGHIVLANMINNLDGNITLVETGPLTCIAKALPFITSENKTKITNLIWMGGSIDVAGNIETFTKHDGTAEWNSYWDPVAAECVFKSLLPITMCPLDTTNNVPITTDFLRKLAIGSNGNIFGDLVVQIYAIIGKCFGVQNYYAWDILTVSYLLAPDIFEIKDAKISIYPDGDSQGRTYRCDTGADVKFLSNVDVDKWENLLISYLN